MEKPMGCQLKKAYSEMGLCERKDTLKRSMADCSCCFEHQNNHAQLGGMAVGRRLTLSVQTVVKVPSAAAVWFSSSVKTANS